MATIPNCPCCGGPACLPAKCLCDPPQLLDLILFGGNCDQCVFPLGVRIPLLCCVYVSGFTESCIGFPPEVAGCRFCWTTSGCTMANPTSTLGVPTFAANCTGNLYPGQSGGPQVPWPQCCSVQDPPNSGQFVNNCYPKITLHCIRGSQFQTSYQLYLNGTNINLGGGRFGNVVIYWTAKTVVCNPFQISFDNSTGSQQISAGQGDSCAGSYPTSAIIIPHA